VHILRRWVTTATAPVDIAGRGIAERLPALQPDRQNPITFSRWMLERLGLPIVEVPQAPTRPDSDPTPVTLNDFLMYCILDQDDIDTNVFGHRDTFKNIK